MAKSKQNLGTAVHEAGHAIVNSYLRLPMRCVTIIPNAQENAAGYVEWKGDIRYTERGSVSQELQAMNAATSALAGRVSVENICPALGAEWHYTTDEHIVVDAYGRPNVSNADFRRYRKWRGECLKRARRIVRERRVNQAIIALAKVLRVRKTIGGDEASRFLTRSKLPTHERRFRQRVLQRELRAMRNKARAENA